MLFRNRFLSSMLAVCFMIGIISCVQVAKAGDFKTEGTTLDVITSVARIMTYQGILKDGDGNPLPDSALNITFRIFDAHEYGNEEWSNSDYVITDDGGYFSATLIDLDLPFDEDYYLELQAEGEAQPMTPRQKINMSAYSARSDTSDHASSSDQALNSDHALNADMLDGKNAGNASGEIPVSNGTLNINLNADKVDGQNYSSDWPDDEPDDDSEVPDDISINNGCLYALSNNDNVGIGTTDPQQTLDVNGTVRLNLPSGLGYTRLVQANSDGDLGIPSASKRYMKNIRRPEIDPEEVLKLHPVRFEWEATDEEDIGLVAEDVEEIFPDLVIHDGEGNPDAVKYDRVVLYLLELVKAQQQKISALENKIGK